MFDATTCRFAGIDPKDQPSMSPYIYAANNPLKFTDPDGKQPIVIEQTADKKKENKSRPPETTKPPGLATIVPRIATTDSSQLTVPTLRAAEPRIPVASWIFDKVKDMIGDVPVAFGITNRNLFYGSGIGRTALYSVEELEAVGAAPRVDALANSAPVLIITALFWPAVVVSEALPVALSVPALFAPYVTLPTAGYGIYKYNEAKETEEPLETDKKDKP